MHSVCTPFVFIFTTLKTKSPRRSTIPSTFLISTTKLVSPGFLLVCFPLSFLSILFQETYKGTDKCFLCLSALLLILIKDKFIRVYPHIDSLLISTEVSTTNTKLITRLFYRRQKNSSVFSVSIEVELNVTIGAKNIAPRSTKWYFPQNISPVRVVNPNKTMVIYFYFSNTNNFL